VNGIGVPSGDRTSNRLGFSPRSTVLAGSDASASSARFIASTPPLSLRRMIPSGIWSMMLMSQLRRAASLA